MRDPASWPLESFARDTAELIEAVCDPLVALVGLSLGGAIVQQVTIDHPHLLRCVITMGTGARSTGWGWDYQKAEIDWRKAGGRLDGMMAVAHNAAKWEACLLYDQMDTLPACTVPMHVIAFCEDVQAPPQDGREVARRRWGGGVPRVRGHGPLFDLWAHARHPEPLHLRPRTAPPPGRTMKPAGRPVEGRPAGS